MKRLVFLLVMITIALLSLQIGVRGAEQGAVYLSPRPEARLVQAESTIVFRFAEDVDAGSLSDTLLQVRGSMSRNHEGKLILANDERTVIFKPAVWIRNQRTEVIIYRIYFAGLGIVELFWRTC